MPIPNLDNGPEPSALPPLSIRRNPTRPLLYTALQPGLHSEESCQETVSNLSLIGSWFAPHLKCNLLWKIWSDKESPLDQTVVRFLCILFPTRPWLLDSHIHVYISMFILAGILSSWFSQDPPSSISDHLSPLPPSPDNIWSPWTAFRKNHSRSVSKNYPSFGVTFYPTITPTLSLGYKSPLVLIAFGIKPSSIPRSRFPYCYSPEYNLFLPL